MAFLTVILIAGILGCLLGYFAAKKWKPERARMIEGLLLGAVLGLSVYAALEVSKVYFVCTGLIAGELVRIVFPKRKQ